MLYKPAFCCNCGEKIERADWKFSHSRRFCDVCQTDYLFQDWLNTAVVTAVALVGIFGVGAMITAADPPPAVIVRPVNRPNAPGNRISNAVPTPAIPSNANRQPIVRQPISEPSPDEVEICGAPTKKGTACTRRVKGGGRCWQHKESPPDRTNSAPRASLK